MLAIHLIVITYTMTILLKIVAKLLQLFGVKSTLGLSSIKIAGIFRFEFGIFGALVREMILLKHCFSHLNLLYDGLLITLWEIGRLIGSLLGG